MTALVFDLDGTLIDSAPDIHAAVNRVLAAESRPPLSLSRVITFIGHGLPALVRQVMAARDLPETQFDRLLADTLHQYEVGGAGLTRLFDGLEPALQILRAEGHAMAVCTNKPHAPAVQILVETGLDKFFTAVIGGDSLPQRKPAPEPLRAAIDALGQTRALYVGDSEVDAETAAGAGVDFALFTEGYRKRPVAEIAHDLAFDRFDALPALVRAWAKDGAAAPVR